MRSEFKYLIPDDVLPELRAQIAPFMRLDRHGRGYERRGYTVRSLYLDTHRLDYYYEKVEGLKDRKKLRIRAYNEPEPTSPVFLEIKRKRASAILKDRVPLAFGDLDAFFSSGEVDRYVRSTRSFPNAPERARGFLYHVYRSALRPVNLVVYEREAFLGRFDSSLRLTFDRNLRGSLFPALDMLYGESEMRYVFPGWFILEVKFDTAFPAWLRPILGRYGWKKQALSKYVLCLDLYQDRLRRNPAALLPNALWMHEDAEKPIPPKAVQVPHRASAAVPEEVS